MITDAIRKAADQYGLPRMMPDCIRGLSGVQSVSISPDLHCLPRQKYIIYTRNRNLGMTTLKYNVVLWYQYVWDNPLE